MEMTQKLHIPSLSLDGVKSRVSRVGTAIGKHEIFLLAGSLAYTTALALAPFVMIMLAIAAMLGQGLQEKLYANLSSVLGEQAGTAITMVVENADNKPSLSGFSSILGFLVLAFSASAIFSQLRIALDKINERVADEKDSGIWSFLREKFFSIGLVFGFIFLSIASLVVTTALAVVLPSGDGLLWKGFSFLINFAIFSGLFALMYRFIPSDRLPWRRCLISGLVSAVFYIAGKAVIGIYLGNAGLGTAYGAAGSLVVFLVWVYYTTLTLLMSYEFTNNVVLEKPAIERLNPGAVERA